MASQPRTHNDYTVGWVCALPKEQTAAIAMLDQRHPELPKPLNDSNTYTLGSIGEHNIVVACLPKGKIGTNSAATVAVLMITAFPAIRFGLMVGIGGGIPPYVRLGDVVVSAPTDQYPGVVQWDVGKAEHGGKSKRTGALNNPPLSLLTALARLETEHEMTGPRIPEILEEMGKTWPRLAAKYLRSDLLNDTLFEPDYQHSNEDPKGRNVALVYGAGDKEDSCRYCDGSRAIQRVPREMQVHYGLIASGNIVIKDAIFRDKLCQDLGGNVLCVEMEAAGLMNNFPCLVIRGICDYADSHKNKIWQEHAAATAAAFAKELLGYVQPSDVDHEKRVKDILYHIFNVVDSIKEDIGYTKLRLYEKEDLEILDWLIPSEYDYGLQQTDNLRRRQPGTGQWLLDSKEYCEWVREPNKTLFCPGIPGSGKTIMTSIVVDDLEDRFRINEATTAVAYIYCNYKRQNDQTVENLLSSLLKQLLAQCQLPLPRNLKELYERHKTKRTRPSLDEISKALEFATAQNSKVFIVIDALDELQASNGFLSSIFDLQIRTGVNLFVTSRNVPRITARFKECISKEIRATESDIRRYLQANIAKLPSFIANQHNLQDEIVRGITKGVDGMFLLAQLHFNSLTDKFTINEIREALNRLMEGGPSPYDSAYRTAMERINGQLEGQARRAKQVLSWVTCAKRQLTKVELQHALGIKIDETKIDKDNLPWIEDLVSVCAGLIAVDQKSSIVRLVHYTTQEYFVRTQNDWFLNTELSITEICLSYLSYQVFANGYSDTDETFEERLRLYPFYDYAARNWGHHGRSLLANHRILSFLRKPAQLQASSQVLMLNNQYKYGNYSQRTPKHMTGLHLAAFFGLKEVVMTLLHEYNTDVKDSHSRTPLSYAAENGHEAIVRLLLQTERVDPDSRDSSNGRTPLSYAARSGHEAIVRLLLQTERVDPDSKDSDGWTPLSRAAENGHEAVVRLLLQTEKVDPDSKDSSDGRTPLLRAVRSGYEAIVRLLLQTERVDPDSKDSSDGRTPLSYAARNGHEAIVRLLLQTEKVDPDLKDSDGRTPLSYAAENGHEAIVRLLLQTEKVDPDSKSKYGWTPLSRAAGRGHEAIAQLLLQTERVDPDSKSKYGWTPLSCAAENGHEAIVQLLLQTERVDPDSKDEYGWTPLLHAAGRGHKAIVQLLLQTERVDPDSKDEYGWTPLLYAAGRGHKAIVQLLLQTERVDPDLP